jgi:uncharacterized protein YbjT (DUF2867 family)
VARSSAATAQKNGAFEIVHGDLRDPDSLDEAVRGVDAVFHLGPAFVADEAQLGLDVVAAAQRGGVGKVVFSGVAHPSDWLENNVSKRPVEDALSGLTFAVAAGAAAAGRAAVAAGQGCPVLRAETVCTRLVLAPSAGYAGLTGLTSWQALRG